MTFRIRPTSARFDGQNLTPYLAVDLGSTIDPWTELIDFLTRAVAEDRNRLRAGYGRFPHDGDRGAEAQLDAITAVITMWRNALHAVEHGATSSYIRGQNHGALDILCTVLVALAQPYQHRPGWQEEWTACA